MAIFLFVIMSTLYFGRVKAKDFTSLVPDINSSFATCKITNIDKGILTLNEIELEEFIILLKDSKYYYNGKYNNILVGNIYHVDFFEENNSSQSLISTMIISDENIVYIGDKQYNINPDSTKVIDFLQSLY